MKAESSRCGRQQVRGVTLIELMITLLIGSILSLAVFAVLTVFEGRKRSATSVNDVGQAGAYAMFLIDRWVRSAGSGFAQSGTPTPDTSPWVNTAVSFGCPLFAARNNVDILPRGANALPAPFSNVNTGVVGSFRLAPVLIAPGQTIPGVSGQPSDVLIVMSGAAGYGDVPLMSRIAVLGGNTVFAVGNQINLGTSASVATGDLVLVADQPGSGTVRPCMLQQVANAAAGTLGLTDGTGFGKSTIGAGIDAVSITSYSSDAVVMPIGNVVAGNPPSFILIGVGDHNTLFAYDLLQTAGADANPNPNLQALADGVFELHALYGVDTNDDGRVDTWTDPGDAGSDYRLDALMDGSREAARRVAQIKALRVALILRTSLSERDEVAPESLTMFGDLGAAVSYTRELSSEERHFRYRVVESTIPLRNLMLVE